MEPYVAAHLKNMNRRTVYNYMTHVESSSKSEISKVTGISGPTVGKIVDFFLEKGLLVELGTKDNGIGRKPHEISINKSWVYAASFFYEGSLLVMGIVDISGNVIYRESLVIEIDPETLFHRIAETYVEQMFQNAGISLEKLIGISIAIPSIYDPERDTISGGLTIEGKEEIALGGYRTLLENKFKAKVFFENDSNAQAMGELRSGKYREDEDMIFISIGSGVGSGLIMNGKLRRGCHNMCGEIGYSTYDSSHVADKKEEGWLEGKIGYRALSKKYHLDLFSDNRIDDSRQLRSDLINDIAPLLALNIANTSVFLDCKNVVLGGCLVEKLGTELVDAVNTILHRISISPLEVQMETSSDVGLQGAASMVLDLVILKLMKE